MNNSLYLHIPFCAHRCAYCDFNTYAGQQDSIPAYVHALTREIEHIARVAESSGRLVPVHTVFFGGGTPSLLKPSRFAAILVAIRSGLNLQPDAEITIEANPGTVTRGALAQLRRMGINRISFGVQSANLEELRMLERQHSFFDVIHAVEWARTAGFENLNLDLIYNLPEQRIVTWQSTVKRAVDLHPEHLSLYALTLEHGTPFGRWAARGLLPMPDPDLAAEMYLWAAEYLAGAGYLQYEISNWARNRPASASDHAGEPGHPPDFACLHNLQYWRSLPYLAVGAGAHGYVEGIRYSNVLRIKTYIDRVESSRSQRNGQGWPWTSAAVNQHHNSLRENMGEFMITGLRLTGEGVSAAEFQARFSTQLEDVYCREIERLLGLGLLEWFGSPGTDSRGRAGLRLSPRARLLANQVFMEFV